MSRVFAVSLLAGLLCGCSEREPAEAIVLATTTSTQDSGLLDHLVPLFRGKTGIDVKVVAVGSGQALQLGRRGDADVLLAHSPAAEEQFMAEGHGAQRHPVMVNDFVLVGPEGDPAGVRATESIFDALARIAEAQATFISREDESGTHRKEEQIWLRAEIAPQGDWYVRAGAGMGHVLRMASEKQAYTLADRGTFLALHERLDLVVLAEGDPLLVNPYHVILVNPEKHPQVRAAASRRFADFLLSVEGQRAIAEFGKERFGQPLFFPAAGKRAPAP